MKDINIVSLTGRLTRAMELKYTSSGSPIGKFSLAVNRNKKQGDKWVDEASFFECAYFGKAAEALAQYLVQGKQVALSGEMRQERWTQDGQNYSRVVVVVSSLSLMGSKDENQNRQTNNTSKPPQQQPQTRSNPPQPAQGPESYYDDEIPF
ncbi:single-stranded DNA-binding protein [Sphaerochaeta sp. PS]|uniref:single-stranded DNA-binding protein n=1 Tax=Sphaerochaeta sp. PS TaxID=3076336 RepID=UPI0028A4B59B|nr:single-stranded DNA-binding protein [Sphaerochaeta sp. PS]MDT4761839.1 single-stranded DNA-binding protein [Sphaerochaeta sp. PS]